MQHWKRVSDRDSARPGDSWVCEPENPDGAIVVEQAGTILVNLPARPEDADFARWWAMRLVEAATLADLASSAPTAERTAIEECPQHDPDPPFTVPQTDDWYHDPVTRRWRARTVEAIEEKLDDQP